MSTNLQQPTRTALLHVARQRPPIGSVHEAFGGGEALSDRWMLGPGSGAEWMSLVCHPCYSSKPTVDVLPILTKSEVGVSLCESLARRSRWIVTRSGRLC